MSMTRTMTMPRSSDGGKAEKTTTKVDKQLIKMARQVAIERGMELFDYLEGIIRPVIERDHAKWVRQSDRN